MSSQPVTHTFHMEMTCSGCSGAAVRVLNKLGADKVSDVEADHITKTVKVTSSLSSDELLETLKKTGKTVTYTGLKM